MSQGIHRPVYRASLLGKWIRHAVSLASLLCPLFCAAPAHADKLTIAVASNFTAPMREIAARFEARSEHKLQLAFGSSGKLFAQINHGAPFQAFFSADQEKPARLIQQGLADADTQFTYAQGQLALWSLQPELVDSQGKVLAGPNYNKLAIANPRLAPYGAAAVETLKNLDLLETTRPRWVQGENIAQTYQFVATENADLGMVALSQIARAGQISAGSTWVVPENLHSPIRQDAVQLTSSDALNEFWQYMKSPETQNIIRSFGYKISEPRR